MIALAGLLGGCAIGSDLYSALPSNSDEQVEFMETQAVYRRLIAENLNKLLKDHAPLTAPYISGLRKTHPIEPGDWIACLKDGEHNAGRTFAVFFREKKLVDMRVAVMIDECEGQAYQPFALAAEARQPEGLASGKPSLDVR